MENVGKLACDCYCDNYAGKMNITDYVNVLPEKHINIIESGS